MCSLRGACAMTPKSPLTTPPPCKPHPHTQSPSLLPHPQESHPCVQLPIQADWWQHTGQQYITDEINIPTGILSLNIKKDCQQPRALFHPIWWLEHGWVQQCWFFPHTLALAACKIICSLYSCFIAGCILLVGLIRCPNSWFGKRNWNKCFILQSPPKL